MSHQMTFFAPVTQPKTTSWPADYQERFWREYPVKVSKRAAMKALEKVKDRCTEWEELIDGVRRYALWLAAPEWRPSPKHPATWLNGDCWNDELPSGGINGQATTAQRARLLAGQAADIERSRGIGRTPATVGSNEHRR